MNFGNQSFSGGHPPFFQGNSPFPGNQPHLGNQPPSSPLVNQPLNLPPNVLQLSRPLFSSLEYKLRLALKSVSATVVRAFALKSQQQTEEWMRNIVGERSIVESWIDVSQLNGENTIQRIVERGIQVPEYGVRISCGNIHLEPVEEQEIKLGTHLQDSPKKIFKQKKVYRLLHVWACIGRPFVTEAKEGEIVIPHGYDSVYLQSAQNTDPNNGEYHHKFILYDTKKLFADYLVYLEYSPDGDEMLKETLEIDGFDLNSSFRRVSIASTKSQLNNSVIDEVYNKIISNIQSKEEELQNDTMPIVMETDDQSIYIDRAKDLLEYIEQRRAQVCENAIEVEGELRDQFKRALLELHDITQLKLSKLCSLEIEITRRIQELQWMNEFIQYQQPILDPLSFIESYSHHTKIKESNVLELEKPIEQAEATVQSIRPDIQFNGKIQVTSETEQITEQMLKQKQVVIINPTNQERKDFNRSTILEGGEIEQ